MNPILAALRSRSNKLDRIDGEYISKCNDHGWSIRYGYIILQRATPTREWDTIDGRQREEGQGHEVDIKCATLVRGENEVELPLLMLSLSDFSEMEAEIAAELDAE
jgi:hypothetical protein